MMIKNTRSSSIGKPGGEGAFFPVGEGGYGPAKACVTPNKNIII